MALFDSVISSASEKFGLGDKAGTMLSALLALITNDKTGGFSGFIDKFKNAGLGDTATSWITSGDNAEISGEQLESALGMDTISSISQNVGMNNDETSAALAYMTPKVIDNLTPEGEVPESAGLLETIGKYAMGGAIAGGIPGIAAGNNVIGDDTANATTARVVDRNETVTTFDDTDTDDDGGSILKWLLPLILLAILMAIGFYACGDRTVVAPTDANQNTEEKVENNGATDVPATTAEAVDSSFRIEAKNGKYVATGVVEDEATKTAIMEKLNTELGEGSVNFDGLKVNADAKDFGANWSDNFGKLLPNLKDWKTGTLAFVGNRVTEAEGLSDAANTQLKTLYADGWTLPASITGTAGTANTGDRKLGEVTLSDGTKLEAYPDGIEDQLVKFIQSDEYKNAKADDLKEKWFAFDDLNFKFGTTELVPESKRQLDNIAAILKAYPEVKIKIGGYTDKKGDDAANKKLSDERAKAVKVALEKANVGTQVPEAEGYGEEFAKVPESASDAERLSDRRTSVRLIK